MFGKTDVSGKTQKQNGKMTDFSLFSVILSPSDTQGHTCKQTHTHAHLCLTTRISLHLLDEKKCKFKSTLRPLKTTLLPESFPLELELNGEAFR